MNLTVIPSDSNECDGSFFTEDGSVFRGGNALGGRRYRENMPVNGGTPGPSDGAVKTTTGRLPNTTLYFLNINNALYLCERRFRRNSSLQVVCVIHRSRVLLGVCPY